MQNTTHDAIIEMRGITKHFGAVTANDNVDLTLRSGEILSLLGENGSGKTSLMNMRATFSSKAARLSSAPPRMRSIWASA